MSNAPAKRCRPAKDKEAEQLPTGKPRYETNYPEWFVITSDYHSHRPALLFGLLVTKGDVIELGMGEGSTKLLNEYGKQNGRKIKSLETNRDWANKYMHLTCDTHSLQYIPSENLELGDVHGKLGGLVFIDIAPGERRAKDLKDLANLTDLVVIHDSQPSAPYGLDFSMYKYKLDCPHPAAWTTLCSNNIDLSQYHGLDLGVVKFHSWNEPSDRLPNV